MIGLLLAIYLTAELGVALWIYGTPGGHRQLETLSILLSLTLLYSSCAPLTNSRQPRVPS